MNKHAYLAVVALIGLTATAAGAELRGKVLQGGRPAAGAKVWAAAVFVSPPLRLETKADAKGEFRLELKPLESSGNWSVRASLGRQGGEANDAYGTINLPKEGDPDPVVIHLEERGLLRGRVTEADSGKPIAGARLFLDSGEIVATGKDGRYEVGGLKLEDHTLIVVSPGRQRLHVLFDNTLRADAELDIRLPRAAVIRGRILDEQGKPIPGACVDRPASGDGLAMSGWDEVCDAEGRFTYEVPFDRLIYSLWFTAPWHHGVQRELVVIRENEEPTWDFRLRAMSAEEVAAIKAQEETKPPQPPASPRHDLSGHVLLAVNKPLAGVIVRWGTTVEEGLKRETRTDEKGNFTLKDVPDRDGLLVIIPPAQAPQFADAPKGQGKVTVRVEEGQVAGGVVRGWQDRPLAGVLVEPVLNSPDRRLADFVRLTERAAVTDDRGVFQLRGLPAGVRFSFYGQGLQELHQHTLKLGANNNIVDMELSRGAVRGRVYDPEGKPVRDFRIRIQRPRVHAPNEETGGYYVGYESVGVSFTADDGSFIVSDLGAPGALVRVSAIVDGYGQAVVDRALIHPVDDQLLNEGITLRLTRPHALRVRVVAEKDGKPIPNAAVTLIDGQLELDKKFTWGYDELGTRSVRTDKEGWVAFPDLAFDEATVLVQSPGHGRTRLAWRKREKELKVALLPEAIVEGTVTIKLAEFPGIWIRLDSAAGDSYHASVDMMKGGPFRIDQLPAGEYTLTIPDRGGDRPESFSLKTGETRKVQRDIERLTPDGAKP